MSVDLAEIAKCGSRKSVKISVSKRSLHSYVPAHYKIDISKTFLYRYPEASTFMNFIATLNPGGSRSRIG